MILGSVTKETADVCCLAEKVMSGKIIFKQENFAS